MSETDVNDQFGSDASAQVVYQTICRRCLFLEAQGSGALQRNQESIVGQ